eukprot:Phypoly_transcript_01314.p1 GENE.Phypoly_transcript_01314~~Phypoly_transcript_01314.p1  ORF type:complete len:1011 (+),score=114.29 Phypoly_transcript_01314:384-3416(+)
MTIMGFDIAIRIGGNTTNYIYGVTFLNNNQQGIQSTTANSSSTIINCNFHGNGNNAGTYGVLEINSANSINYVTNCTFSNNICFYGCLTLTQTSALTYIDNCTFSGNYAGDGGAGIFLHMSNAIVTNSIFTNNEADAYGCAINLIETCTITVKNSRFENNTARGHGVFAAETGSYMTIVNSQIFNNTFSGTNGSLIYLESSHGDIQDCTIHDNTATFGMFLTNISSGSFYNTSVSSIKFTNGIYMDTNGTVTVNNSTFFGAKNTAIQLSHANAKLVANNSKIYSNGDAGISAQENTEINLLDTDLYGNKEGIVLTSAQGTITGGSISNCKSGGIRALGGSLRLQGVTVNQNNATTGGGIFAQDYISLEIGGSTITNNTATTGGGIYLQPLTTSTTKIANSQILDNVAPVGDGIFVANISSTNIEKTINMSAVKIATTNTSAMTFCCVDGAQDSVSGQVCNFPACGGCTGSSGVGCDCTVPLPCASCLQGWRGHNCVEDINECAELNFKCPDNSTCNNLPGSYNCTCTESGYENNGTACIDINECDHDPCDTNAHCDNLPGTFRCACNPGYVGNGTICNDENECEGTYNGNCVLFSMCNNFDGGYNCTCNEGYFKNGSICSAYCGDHKCEDTRNETCTSCPQDCKQSSCMVCHDGFCDTSIENCTTCPNDCGVCAPVLCGGNPECNGHGNCNSDGVCECSGAFTGPLCDYTTDELAPLTVQSHANAATISFATSKLNFTITVTRIVEYQTDSVSEAQVIALSDINYGFTPSGNVGNTQNQKWVYNSTLFNRANFNMAIELFGEPSTPYPFAGVTRNFPKNSLKLNMAIENWPFLRAGNSLGIEIHVGDNNLSPPSCSDNHQNGGSLNWLTISYNSGTLYGQFLQAAVLDGRVQNITYKSDQNSITAVVPHFWEFAEIDPDFSVLLVSKEKDPCTGKITREKSNKTLIIAIVVPVVVVVVLFALAIAYWTKIHMRKHVRAQRRNIKLQSVDSEPARDSERRKTQKITRLDLS